MPNEPGQLFERFVLGKDLLDARHPRREDVVEWDLASRALERTAAAGVIDENPPHARGGDAEEVGRDYAESVRR